MIGRMLTVGLAFGLCACTQLPPPPVGAGGAPGDGGSAGNGGFAGGGGLGGADPCTTVIPVALFVESGDIVTPDGVVSGFLCAGSCDAEDLLDVWSFTTTCGGNHDILLTWTNNLSDDLNLSLFDSQDQLVAECAESTTSGQQELISENLQERETYTVEVSAANTSGAIRNYRLRVTRSD